MNQEETVLKKRARAAGLTTKDLAMALDKPYASVAGRLNGFMPLLNEDRMKILKIITEAEEQKVSR